MDIVLTLQARGGSLLFSFCMLLTRTWPSGALLAVVFFASTCPRRSKKRRARRAIRTLLLQHNPPAAIVELYVVDCVE